MSRNTSPAPEAASQEALVSALFDGHLVGSYLIIGEAYDEDGAPFLAVKRSDDMTVWKELGMLRSASNRADVVDQSGWAYVMGMTQLDNEDDE